MEEIVIGQIKNYMNTNYPIDINRVDIDGETHYELVYPDLPGLSVISANLDDGIEKVRAAKLEWFKTAIDNNYDIPEPHTSRL